MSKPPFLLKGFSGERESSSFVAIIVSIALFVIGSLGVVLLLAPLLNRYSKDAVESGALDFSSSGLAALDTAIMSGFVSLAILVLLYFWLKYFEKRPFATLGIERSKWPLLIRGLFGGAAAACLLIILLLIFTDAQLEYVLAQHSSQSLILAFIVLPLAIFFNACAEELVFRSYLLQSVGKYHGILWGTLCSSILYSVLHLELGTPFLFFFVSVSLYACFLCFYATVESSVWGPIGFSFAWNFISKMVFAFTLTDVSRIEFELQNGLDHSPKFSFVHTTLSDLVYASAIVTLIMFCVLIILALNSRMKRIG